MRTVDGDENGRVCTGCKVYKPFSEFHRMKSGWRGYHSHCKSCAAEKAKEYFSTEQGKKARRRANKRYYNTERGKRQTAKDTRRYNKRYPKKKKSHDAVGRAVERGKLPHISTRTCVNCGAQADHYHHHNGYGRKHRLDVVPMCQTCHFEEDGIL